MDKETLTIVQNVLQAQFIAESVRRKSAVYIVGIIGRLLEEEHVESWALARGPGKGV